MNENVYKYLESLSKLGRNYCHANNPICLKCPMNKGCKYRVTVGNQRKGLLKK